MGSMEEDYLDSSNVDLAALFGAVQAQEPGDGGHQDGSGLVNLPPPYQPLTAENHPEAFARFDNLVILPPPQPHQPQTPQHLQIRRQLEQEAIPWGEDFSSQQRNQDQVVPNQEEEVSKMQTEADEQSIAWPS